MMQKLTFPPERYPIYHRWLFAVFVLALPVVTASSWMNFSDGDVSWQVAAGRWILEHARVPDTDPFSYTMGGRPWVTFEWGSQIVLAAAFNLAGYAGLSAVVASALMTIYLVIFLHLRRRVGPIAMLMAFVAVNLVLYPFVLARPHVLGWALIALWTSILLKCRDNGRSPPLTAALLMFVWANLHGSFFIGFIIAGAIALDALIAANWNFQALRSWVLFGIATLLAALLNANGLDGFTHPLRVVGMNNLSQIGEWNPSNPSTSPLFFAVFLCGLAVMLHKQVKLSLGELSLLVFTLAMAFWHSRHQAVFIIIAALIAPPRIRPGLFNDEAQSASLAKAERAWLALAVVAGLMILAVRAHIPLLPRETYANPRGLIAHVPESLKNQPVLNEYSIGGPLILAGIRPYIDGRSDMYGDQFMSDYLKIMAGDEARFRRAVSRHGIRWTVLQNESRLVEVLDKSKEWKRHYSDEVGVIHIRQPTTAAGEPPESGDSERTT